MNTSRIAAFCSSTLLLLSMMACSSDDSGSSSTSSGPFESLAGNFGVAVVPQFSNCEGAVYYPQEAWVVVPVGSLMNVVPVPIPGGAPLPVAVAEPADAAAPQDAATAQDAAPSQSPSPQPAPQDTSSGQQPTPPTFSAVMDSTLHFEASKLETSTTENGCLKRTTTFMDVQFTADAKLAGTRSVFNEYAGGTDCPTDCRMVFAVQGAKLPQ